MAGIAALAREAGHRVTGSDANAWPPMSTQLEALGIEVMPGYEVAHLRDPEPDAIIVGNVMTRGHDVVEWLLSEDKPLVSGPQWLAEHVLRGRHVLAVAGTHGKTTTSAMLAHILRADERDPGWLVGGLAADLGVSAALGSSLFFFAMLERGYLVGTPGSAPLRPTITSRHSNRAQHQRTATAA